MRFDEEIRARLRAELLRRGQLVATQLAALMAGKSPDLSAFPGLLAGSPRQRLEDRLRAYLQLLNAQRVKLESGDASYGCCEQCGVALPLVVLEEMPWAQQCQSCASAS